MAHGGRGARPSERCDDISACGGGGPAQGRNHSNTSSTLTITVLIV